MATSEEFMQYVIGQLDEVEIIYKKLFGNMVCGVKGNFSERWRIISFM